MSVPGQHKNGRFAEFLNPPFFCSVTALVLSFLGILTLLSGDAYRSFAFILIAVLFDMLDGSLSRKLKLESDFGALFDLLQDVINYLLYPAILFFTLGFRSWIALILLCLFLICGVFRLARFGTIGFSKEHGQLGYVGMPVYFNHLCVLVFFALLPGGYPLPFLLVSLPLISALMVSKISFPKPKSIILWGSVLVAAAAVFFWI